MNYATIKKHDVANGPGIRVSLFVSGCTHHCKNCFNPETWDFSYGNPFTGETQEEIFAALEPSYIRGLSLLGGEPMEPANQRALLPFLKEYKKRFPDKTIWCYSGYLLDEELLKPSRARCECTDEILSMLDVLVDGEYVEELKSLSIRFRGSTNQRLIDVPKTLESGAIVEWNE